MTWRGKLPGQGRHEIDSALRRRRGHARSDPRADERFHGGHPARREGHVGDPSCSGVAWRVKVRPVSARSGTRPHRRVSIACGQTRGQRRECVRGGERLVLAEHPTTVVIPGNHPIVQVVGIEHRPGPDELGEVGVRIGQERAPEEVHCGADGKASSRRGLGGRDKRTAREPPAPPQPFDQRPSQVRSRWGRPVSVRCRTAKAS